MTLTSSSQLSQRADFTHKFNIGVGRHGWLRLTPAYSIKIVEDLLDKNNDANGVFDPFCGTATTALCAASRGHFALSTDINPFLVWLGNAKTSNYSDSDLSRTRVASEEALENVRHSRHDSVAVPNIHNIERWWSPATLSFLSRLRNSIDSLAPINSKHGSLLRIAFCRTLIKISNAAFNHQSMSFRDSTQVELHIDTDFDALFREDLDYVVSGAAENPIGEASVRLEDARCLGKLGERKFDLVITSPPYANRMSYIRELRPYMYWLNFLANGRDAGELDWTAIGGTWGIATSRLSSWEPSDERTPSSSLRAILSRIAKPENANGQLLATYVQKYCQDMMAHFESLSAVLSHGARVHYIVGNSTFYGQLLPVEQIYAEYLAAVGFHDISIKAIRKRNSKKALIEFDVSGKWR